MKYTVTKQHYGDRQYLEGEEREIANKVSAQRLIRMGLIADPEAKAVQKKAAPKPRNKAEPAPKNKAD